MRGKKQGLIAVLHLKSTLMPSKSCFLYCYDTAGTSWLTKLNRTVPKEIKGRISNKDMPAVNEPKRSSKPTRKDAWTKDAAPLWLRLQAGTDKGAKHLWVLEPMRLFTSKYITNYVSQCHNHDTVSQTGPSKLTTPACSCLNSKAVWEMYLCYRVPGRKH